jgi:hypothetical protein
MSVADFVEKRDEAGQPSLPFTNEAIVKALTVDFNSHFGDGRNDPDIDFDDTELTEPQGYDKAQQTLPGIEPLEPHEYLTAEMHQGLTKALVRKFNRVAENNAGDIEPPDYLAEGVGDMQYDYWSSMDDADRFRAGERYATAVLESGERIHAGEMPEEDADRLRTLARSSDPKALWAIADSKWGEKILLGRDIDWVGTLDLHDKETMARFNAYVGKTKKAA